MRIYFASNSHSWSPSPRLSPIVQTLKCTYLASIKFNQAEGPKRKHIITIPADYCHISAAAAFANKHFDFELFFVSESILRSNRIERERERHLRGKWIKEVEPRNELAGTNYFDVGDADKRMREALSGQLTTHRFGDEAVCGWIAPPPPKPERKRLEWEKASTSVSKRIDTQSSTTRICFGHTHSHIMLACIQKPKTNIATPRFGRHCVWSGRTCGFQLNDKLFDRVSSHCKFVKYVMCWDYVLLSG